LPTPRPLRLGGDAAAAHGAAGHRRRCRRAPIAGICPQSDSPSPRRHAGLAEARRAPGPRRRTGGSRGTRRRRRHHQPRQRRRRNGRCGDAARRRLRLRCGRTANQECRGSRSASWAAHPGRRCSRPTWGKKKRNKRPNLQPCELSSTEPNHHSLIATSGTFFDDNRVAEFREGTHTQ
jgi:hypothetical protein